MQKKLTSPLSSPQVDLQPGALFSITDAYVYMCAIDQIYTPKVVERGTVVMYVGTSITLYTGREVGGCAFIVGEQKLYMWVTVSNIYQKLNQVQVEDKEAAALDYLSNSCGTWARRLDLL